MKTNVNVIFSTFHPPLREEYHAYLTFTYRIKKNWTKIHTCDQLVHTALSTFPKMKRRHSKIQTPESESNSPYSLFIFS